MSPSQLVKKAQEFADSNLKIVEIQYSVNQTSGSDGSKTLMGTFTCLGYSASDSVGFYDQGEPVEGTPESHAENYLSKLGVVVFDGRAYVKPPKR